MIQDLPHGYETLLDRTFAKGQDLSGGQWQRITAARGFLRDADLLVMDEPSSALDPRAEDALFQAIRDRQGRATTILITHRLANVRHADRIFVLHDGALVEAGSHDELVAANGRYAELFALEAAGYDDTHSDRGPAPRQRPSPRPDGRHRSAAPVRGRSARAAGPTGRSGRRGGVPAARAVRQWMMTGALACPACWSSSRCDGSRRRGRNAAGMNVTSTSANATQNVVANELAA